MAKFGWDERRLFYVSETALENLSSTPSDAAVGQMLVYVKSDHLYIKKPTVSEVILVEDGANVGTVPGGGSGGGVFKQKNASGQLEFRKIVSTDGHLDFVENADTLAVTVDFSDINDELDHGVLLGLADDDHLQYFKVIGRTNETLQINGTGKLEWSGDGAGRIGTTAITGRPDDAYIKSKLEVNPTSSTFSDAGQINLAKDAASAARIRIQNQNAAGSADIFLGNSLASSKYAQLKFSAAGESDIFGGNDTTLRGSDGHVAIINLNQSNHIKLVLGGNAGANELVRIQWKNVLLRNTTDLLFENDSGDIGQSSNHRPVNAYFKTKINLDSLTASLPVVSNASKDLVSMSYASFAGNLSHSLLQNLSADDHAQYLLLAGRSGGQIAHGGTAASDNLTLRSTSNATKGKVQIIDGSAFQHADMFRQQYTVQTVDGTVTDAVTYAISDNKVYNFKVYVVSRRSDATGSRGAWELQACAYREGGGATLQGSVKQNFQNRTPGTIDVNIVVSGNNVKVQVTGLAAQTFEWKAYVQILESN